MDIKSATSVMPTTPSITEYQDSNRAPAPVAQKPMAEAIGSQLNRMGGVKADTKLFEQKNGLNKESFLKMMTEQLKFQDPFNPVKNENFTQQMAQLSQLEQSINMNQNLEKMVTAQSSNQLAALQLVGKNITADKAAIYHDAEKPSAIAFKLPQDAADLKVQIQDGNGTVVRTMDLGTNSTGDIQTKWDGASDEGMPMPAGRYSYKIAAKDMGNRDFSVSTKVDGRVTGVTSASGAVFLLVGDQRIGLNDVEMIKEGEGAVASNAVAAFSPSIPAAAGGAVVANAMPPAGTVVKPETKPEANADKAAAPENSSQSASPAGENRLGLMTPITYRQ